MTPTKDVSRFDYLRYRPFLVIEVSTQPAANVRTGRKGWTESVKNLSFMENPSVVDRVSDKIMRQATVIIDIMNDVIVKNRLRLTTDKIDAATSDVEILEHYKMKYSDIVEQGRNAWALRVRAA